MKDIERMQKEAVKISLKYPCYDPVGLSNAIIEAVEQFIEDNYTPNSDVEKRIGDTQ